MKKWKMLLLCTLIVVTLTACGNLSDISGDTIVIDKKGVVTGVIVEEFKESYYDGEELKNMVMQEVSDYNGEAGSENVTLSSFEVKDGIVSVFLEYKNANDYKTFNDKEFFAGTISQAYDAGYNFVEMKSADGTKTLLPEEVLEKGDSHIIIWEEPVAIRTSGAIAYTSSNVEIKANKEAAATAEDGLFYIIY